MSAWMYKTDDPDLQYLFDLARDKTVASRAALTRTVSDLFFTADRTLTDRERALMTDILRQLVHEMEIDIRRDLADRLADRSDIPRELIVTLANDEIEVAHAILVNSTVLADEELIEIIRHRAVEHQLAITLRKSVNEVVSDALVEAGHEDVIRRLLENQGARFSELTMVYLVEQSQRVDSYQNPLLRRPELNPDLAKRMYWWVSAALRKHIIERYEVDPAELDDAIENSVENLAPEPEPQSTGDAPTSLADRISRHYRITSRTLLLQVLRQGEVSLFEALFTKLSGLRITLLRRIVYEPGGEALAILCRSLNFPPREFIELYRLTRKARMGDIANGEDAERMTEIYQRIKSEAAAKTVKNWCRNPKYLQAIHDIKQTAKRHVSA